MKIETEKNKSICLLKVLTWNINKKLECKECIYWKGRCTYEKGRTE